MISPFLVVSNFFKSFFIMLWTIFSAFLKMGLICFGGPIAAIGFFYHEFVEKRAWIDEPSYFSLVSLCQALPGPISSQIAFSIGMKQQGILGGITAFLGFSLPAMSFLITAGYILTSVAHPFHTPWLHGLKLAVVAIIAQAIFKMSHRMGRSKVGLFITLLSLPIALFFPNFWGQIFALILGAVLGKIALSSDKGKSTSIFKLKKSISFQLALIMWGILLFMLFILPLVNFFMPNFYLNLFNIFFRTGAMVFGGGHVVLPLLQTQLVKGGWISNQIFLSGYGITQAIPGPVFSFAAFLGTAIQPNKMGWLLGLFSAFAIFLPSFLILIGILPFWEKYREHHHVQSMLSGMSYAVFALLISVFIHPILTSSILSVKDFCIALGAFILLERFSWPQWLIVILCALFPMVFLIVNFN